MSKKPQRPEQLGRDFKWLRTIHPDYEWQRERVIWVDAFGTFACVVDDALYTSKTFDDLNQQIDLALKTAEEEAIGEPTLGLIVLRERVMPVSVWWRGSGWYTREFNGVWMPVFNVYRYDESFIETDTHLCHMLRGVQERLREQHNSLVSNLIGLATKLQASPKLEPPHE